MKYSAPMIKPINQKILVRVNEGQKDEAFIGGRLFMMAKEYNNNYREKNPVIAEVIKGHGLEGSYLLCHHNMFQGDSCPFRLESDLYAIPFRPDTVFVKIDKDGQPQTILGNIACERIIIESDVELPPDMQKPYLDRVRVISSGDGFKEGETIFVIKYAPYHIFYTIDGVEKQVCKVYKDDILGVV